jgi:hypothetical protein
VRILLVPAMAARPAARHRTDDEAGGQPLTTMSNEEEMMRWLWLLLPAGLLGLAPVAVPWLAAGSGHERDSGVYTVAQVQDNLARDRAAWVGRAVLVRGTLQPSGCISWAAGGAPCHDRAAYLLLERDGVSALQVAGWGPDPLLAALRRLPLVGRLVPRPRAVRWGALATYPVRLDAAPGGSCGATVCVEALLLDAAPDAPGEE